jgi:HupE / UreJ protein
MTSTSIAENGRTGFGFALIGLLALVPTVTGTVEAHPVAQGSMEIVVFLDHVAVLATVSNEEVLVAAALGRGSSDRFEKVRSHGDYLLAHLQVTADGYPLAGRVFERPERTRGRFSYRLEYAFPSGPPARLVLREDVLCEIEFAPGTPWEASYLLRIGHDQQVPTEGLLTCREPFEFECRWRPGSTAEVSSPSPRWERSRIPLSFVRHGILHILSGYDHLLFVGALSLATVSLWDLIKVISAFTVAHTLTLALSVLDVFRLSSMVIEPTIAASIVVVAAQNVFWPESSRGGSRLLVAFGFGLFHGLGFAGGLLEAMSSLNTAGVAWAIAAFSIGVEIGHQVVVLPAFGGLYLLRRVGGGKSDRERLVRRYGSAVILLPGIIYLVVSLP